MSGHQPEHHAAKGHYSGANPVPTVSKFIENLDKDKKERDRLIDEQHRGKNAGGVRPHQPTHAGKADTRKRVTDPTTGREVVIEDTDLDIKEMVDNPKVSVFAHSMDAHLDNILILIADCAKCESWKANSKAICYASARKSLLVIACESRSFSAASGICQESGYYCPS